ncbi:hypothetical protein CRG98_001019, partial [Punica granatum]
GQEIRERLSGAVEAFARRNGPVHGLHGDHSRHRTSDEVPSSKDVQVDSEKSRTYALRSGSTSKRAVLTNSRPSSSGEPSDGRSSRLISGSGGGRLSSTVQRLQPGFESKSSSFTRSGATRGSSTEPLRSFELLSIGTGKRK